VSKKFLLVGFLFAVACSGGGSFNFNDIASIPAGDGAGTALTGTFATILKVKSNDCDSSDLETPVEDSSTPLDLEITQEDGVLQLDKVDVKLNGSVSFENEFEVGGAQVVSRGEGDNNILQMVRVTGKFTSANEFEASGEERLTGILMGNEIDCSFRFELTGVRG
jgi:hypothetical protein